MSHKEIAVTKDKILSEINSGVSNPIEIEGKIKQKEITVRFFCEELEQEGLCELEEVVRLDSGRTKDYLIAPTNKGIVFLDTKGGFYQAYKNNVWQKRWLITKTIAAALNAAAILVIGYLSVS